MMKKNISIQGTDLFYTFYPEAYKQECPLGSVPLISPFFIYLSLFPLMCDNVLLYKCCK